MSLVEPPPIVPLKSTCREKDMDLCICAIVERRELINVPALGAKGTLVELLTDPRDSRQANLQLLEIGKFMVGNHCCSWGNRFHRTKPARLPVLAVNKDVSMAILIELYTSVTLRLLHMSYPISKQPETGNYSSPEMVHFLWWWSQLHPTYHLGYHEPPICPSVTWDPRQLAPPVCPSGRQTCGGKTSYKRGLSIADLPALPCRQVSPNSTNGRRRSIRFLHTTTKENERQTLELVLFQKEFRMFVQHVACTMGHMKCLVI